MIMISAHCEYLTSKISKMLDSIGFSNAFYEVQDTAITITTQPLQAESERAVHLFMLLFYVDN